MEFKTINNLKSGFGSFLKTSLGENNWSQNYFAGLMGVTPKYISMIITGEREAGSKFIDKAVKTLGYEISIEVKSKSRKK